MFRFFPKEEKFFLLFNQMAEKIVQAAQLLKKALNGEMPVATAHNDIRALEHECDDLTHELSKKLNASFVTPFDREDIYRLGSALDNIIDIIDTTMRLIVLYKLNDFSHAAKQLAFIILHSCQAVNQGITALETKRDAVSSVCLEINELENEADAVRANAISELFDTKDPIAIIKWKEIYENLEFVTDCCEDVSNILEGIVIKNA